MAQGDLNISGSQSVGRDAKRRRTLISTGELKFRNFPSYFHILIEKDICMCLDDIETDILLCRPIQWNKLLPVVRAIRVSRETVPECLKFVMELLRLFERHQCKDSSVILEVFIVMIFLTAKKLSVIDRDKFSETSKFIYKPYGTEIDFTQERVIDLAYQAVRSANVGLLKLLLRFGLGILTPYFTSDCSFRYFEVLLRCWPDQEVYPTNLVPDLRIQDKICSVFSPETRKRHCLVLRVLEIVRTMIKYPPGARGAFAECYRLLFDSIPEAYVTSVEVKAFLEKYLHEAYSGLIPEITEAFERLLPKLAEVPQSRSLQHLCRIQVRDSLRQNLNLPHGVSSLPLPTCLKEYVMLHDDGDYSIITRNDVHRYGLEGVRFWPTSFIEIPERDDCITSFLKLFDALLLISVVMKYCK